jgi:hypothetical protein
VQLSMAAFFAAKRTIDSCTRPDDHRGQSKPSPFLIPHDRGVGYPVVVRSTLLASTR